MRLSVLIAAAVVVTACGGSADRTDRSGPAAASAPPSAAIQTPATAASTVPPQAQGTLLCAPSSTTTRVAFAQGAAGTQYVEFAITNTSSRTCRTSGYPGALLLTASGRPLPTHVARDPGPAPNALPPAGPFTVAPGQTFYAEFHYSATEPGCGQRTPPAAPKVRITLPDNRDSVVVALPRTNESGPILACHGDLAAYPVFLRRR